LSGGDLPDRLATYLDARPEPVTYAALAAAMGLEGPGRIATLTAALEALMERDAAAGRPFRAVWAVSRTTCLPARGFFEKAATLGRLAGSVEGPEAAAFAWAERSALSAPPGTG
jgi:hypothetical protein